MTTAELVNLIVAKLGGNRVEFIEIQSWEVRFEANTIEFIHGGNYYDCRSNDESQSVEVWQILRDQGPLIVTQYSQWIEGVLNGKTRNEEGVLL